MGSGESDPPWGSWWDRRGGASNVGSRCWSGNPRRDPSAEPSLTMCLGARPEHGAIEQRADVIGAGLTASRRLGHESPPRPKLAHFDQHLVKTTKRARPSSFARIERPREIRRPPALRARARNVHRSANVHGTSDEADMFIPTPVRRRVLRCARNHAGGAPDARATTPAARPMLADTSTRMS